MNEHLKKLKELVNESSLARIWQFVEVDKKSFGVVSAFRAGIAPEENKKRATDLAIRVRNLKLGYIVLRGAFREEESGEISYKESLFIPNITREQIIELGKVYGQDSILYKDENEFVEIGTNSDTGIGSIRNTFTQGSGRDNLSAAFTDFYSHLLKGSHAGKKFLFTLERKQGDSFNAANARIRKGEQLKWFPVIESTVEIEKD